jgi:APA family basic amino acid/polyamine antiporter
MAVAAIAVLSLINYLGVGPSAVTQNLFTVLKLSALVALIGCGLLLPLHAVAPDTLALGSPRVIVGDPGLGAVVPVLTPWQLPLAVGTALVPILFAYGGWQQTNFIAEEIVDAERTLPRALVIGTAIVVLVYVSVNLAYLRVLGPALAASAAPAADVMSATVGAWGRRLISLGIACSSFGFLNLVILVSPRVYQAMAADGVFLPSLARLHPRFRTPGAAILVQGVWAILLTLSGTYAQLLDYVVFGDWIFFGLTAATLIVFRRRSGPPDRHRVPFYPVAPLLFVLAAAYVVVSSVASNPRNALLGALLLAAGVPVFLSGRRRVRT